MLCWFVSLTSHLGPCWSCLAPVQRPNAKTLSVKENLLNSFKMTSLAGPNYLTPMESYRCARTRGALPSCRRSFEPATIFRIFFHQVPYTLNPLLTHSYENCRGGGPLSPFWNSSIVPSHSTTRLPRVSSVRDHSTLAAPLSMLKLKK